MKSEHVTVLLDEAVDALNIKAGGNYVDATFGRGGHSRRILQKLENGKLLVIDRDPEAILVAKQLSQEDERVVVEYGAFEMLGALIDKNFETGVDGILFDLGISSPQIDVATRGFSFMQDGPLICGWITRKVNRRLIGLIMRTGKKCPKCFGDTVKRKTQQRLLKKLFCTERMKTDRKHR